MHVLGKLEQRSLGLTLWDRIKFAISLPRSLARGGDFDLKTLFEKQRVGINGLDPFPRFDKQKLFTWSRESDLAYSCILKIIEAAQDPDLIVERRKNRIRPWEPEPGHALRQLLMRPNPEMSQAEFLGAWLGSEEACGEFFAEIERDKRGRPRHLWPLDPTCIHPASIIYPGSGKEGWIWRGYSYAEEVHLLPRDVFYSLRRDLQAPWMPLSPLRVALGSVEADAMQTMFVRSFFKNSGVPSGVVKIKGRTLKDEEAEGIRQRWLRRYGAGGKFHVGPAVMDENAEYQKVGSDLSEIEGGTLRAQNEARICGVFGVPPLLVSAYVGLLYVNQRASAKESQVDFWANKMSPTFKRLRSRLTWSLLLEFEDEGAIRDELIRLNWDMSQVVALQESMSERSMRAREDFRVGGLTLNEFRAVLGMAPTPSGDYYLRPVNRLPVTPEIVAEQLLAAAAATSASVSLILSGSRDPKAHEEGGEEKRLILRKVFDWDGLECGREPSDFERRINVKALGNLMGSSSSNLLSVLLPARSLLISDAVSKLRGLLVSDLHKLTLDWPSDAWAELRGILDDVTLAGRNDFLAELRAQGEPESRLIPPLAALASRLDLIADAAVSRLVNDVQARAAGIATHLAPLVSPVDLPARVEAQLNQLSDATTRGIAQEAAHQALALGREVEAANWSFGGFIYSAVLDRNTCQVCRSLDGFTAELFSEMPTVPNPNCGEGFGRCRCAVLPVF